MNTSVSEPDWRREWARLAWLGQCDELDGYEYRWLWEEYQRTPYGMYPHEFIRWRANCPHHCPKNGK